MRRLEAGFGALRCLNEERLPPGIGIAPAAPRDTEVLTYVLSGTPNPALTVVAGALPPGLTLTADGIAGTPTTTGTYDFTGLPAITMTLCPAASVTLPRKQ